MAGGDTFETIARKTYGVESEAFRIAAANPGAQEPLTPGTLLAIPPLPGAPLSSVSDALAQNRDEVAILIDGVRFRLWTEVRITRSIDSIDTAEFSAPFDEANSRFREIFRPFSFKSVVITVGGEPFFTGTLVGVAPLLESNRRIVTATCYATPGVLDDCTAPASAYPIEFNEQRLTDIAQTLLAPFGIESQFDADAGPVFERVACSPGRTILSFLTDLAIQRNLIIASSPRGELVFKQSVSGGAPAAILEQGKPPLLSITPVFNPRKYYSHVTGLEPVVVGLQGSQFTVKNPLLRGVVRPHTYQSSDAFSADLGASVEAKMGRMFGNMVAYQLEVPTWRTSAGDLWESNTIIRVEAPGAMIYAPYDLIVRAVTFGRDSRNESALLELVLPGSFSGEIPEALPWDG